MKCVILLFISLFITGLSYSQIEIMRDENILVKVSAVPWALSIM